jgi:hypothetical protein
MRNAGRAYRLHPSMGVPFTANRPREPMGMVRLARDTVKIILVYMSITLVLTLGCQEL